MAESRFIIFANGAMTSADHLEEIVKAEDMIIAADGGAVHAEAAGMRPHVLIGDLDSIPQDLLERLERSGTQVLRYPARKNETDLELAISYAREQGAGKILLLAALGERWDMTLSSFFLLARWEDDPPGEFSPRISILDAAQEVWLILPGKKYPLHVDPGDTVSLIPLAGPATGVTTCDLEYPLYAETLELGSTRGISNVMLRSHATVEIRSGKLLCFLSRKRRERTGGNS